MRSILSRVSYNFEKGKFYTILGVSGSGKTTFLSLISGLDTPENGGIFYNDKNIEWRRFLKLIKSNKSYQKRQIKLREH